MVRGHGRPSFPRARNAARFGLFSFPAIVLAFSLVAGCGPHDPRTVARAADAARGTGIYTWLADHDPSALRIVGLDSATVRIVAPDARTTVGDGTQADCARAREGHALLAAVVRVGSPDRDRVADCGYALFHDDGSIVVAPR